MARFRTRARTVDMLGRQQIANVSTAISELFKNAYDAYADNAEVDYFRSDDLLVIRDDGVGMTPEEFENRWLVLGTESKFALPGQRVDAYRPIEKVERAIMGEKGIGRLAIALIGRQVFVLTRAKRDDDLHDLLMCFIHWGLFEISDINLDDIEIPVKLITGGRIPNVEEVNELLLENKANIKKLANSDESGNFQQILDDIDDIQFDPENIDEFLGGLTLRENRCGSHFFVIPADESIANEIDRERNQEKKEFSKFLLGFSNSVFRENPPPPLNTVFRHWRSDGDFDDLIGPNEFFTQDELESADHRVSGRFDEYGQFRGNVRIYNEDFIDHVIPWTGGRGLETNCGPFEIEFGYVSGTQRESRLQPDEWKRITSKLNQIGGLYVYRDRIRILPYGNSDIDWLDIEERRTRGAGYYFFSYRRVFGAVTLTRKHNGLLREKAGREGFQQDKTYRQLKDILENLFLQIAADFLRDSGEYYEYYGSQRAELERLELARRKREKQVSAKRQNLAASLNRFFTRVVEGLPSAEINELRSSIEDRMDYAARIKNPEEASIALLDAEQKAIRKLSDIRESYRIVKPRGIGLSRTLQSEWKAYLAELERLENEIFKPFSREVAQTLGVVAEKAKLYVDQRRRLSELIKLQANSEKKLVSHEATQLKDSVNDTKSAVLKLARDAMRELKETVSDVEVEFAGKDLAGMSVGDIEHLRGVFENRVVSVGNRGTETLSKVRDMLTALSSNLQQGMDIAESDIVEAMDQELQELREQSDADAELVQLGLAIAVINHEFEAAIKGVRRALRELRPWASSNEDLALLYQEIRRNFDHLDGHLNLFTPLQRRMYRKRIPIKGADINHYVRTLFEVRFKRHQINFEVSSNFLEAEIIGYPSTIYPVFVNILDNAIFWLKDLKDAKSIKLDAKDAFFISNNGPAIHKRDHELIFEQGFTRKPGGRGLGLFISRKALRNEGMDIEVVPSDSKYGVTIKVKWPKYDERN